MPVAVKARPAQFDRSTQHRRAMMAKINIGRSQISMDEDDYRQGLLDLTGHMSLRACTDAQLDRVLAWLKTKGFQPLPRKGGAPHPMARKARALWLSLYHLGVVHNEAEQALEAFAKRQLGCERLVWARQSDAFRLIEALKSIAKRAGWYQQDRFTGQPLPPITLQLHLCDVILAKLKAAGVAPDDWTIDVAAKRLCGIETAQEEPYSAEDYGRLAAALGNVLRKAAPQAETVQ